jgi:serine/threonine-protein kinase
MDSCPYCAATITSSRQTCPNCGANLKGFQLETGTTLGKYQIEKVLGQGGFGITYQARDTVLQRQVAVKELFPDGSTRQNLGLIPPNSLGISGFLEAKTRFLTEARTLAQFNHPGIVRVFEVFEANNTAYLVMEALTGETLGTKIARAKKLPEETVKKLALELCDALSVVHGVGLLHRDIKPDNIFLTSNARVVLIDFGSARSFRASERTRHTQLVTPGYAAPEQYASDAKFGEYTDVYGVAASLYHALTGTQPPSAGDMFAGTKLKPISSNVSASLRSGIEQGLKAHIDERPQNAKTLKIIIGQVQTQVLPQPDLILTPEEIVEDSLERLIYGSGLSLKVMTDQHFTGIGTRFYTSKKSVKFTKAIILAETKDMHDHFFTPSLIISIPILFKLSSLSQIFKYIESNTLLTIFFLILLVPIWTVLLMILVLIFSKIQNKIFPVSHYSLKLMGEDVKLEIFRSRNRKELEPILHELELIFNSHRQGSPNLP